MTVPTARSRGLMLFCRRRPGLVFLVAAYLLALSLVHDATTLALGALVVGLGLFRAVLTVRLTRRGPA